MNDKKQFIKTQRLSHIQHELKTPINAIIGYSDIISEELEDLENGQNLEQIIFDLKKINGLGKELSSQIDSLADENKPVKYLDVIKLQKVFSQIRSPINTIMGYCEMLLEKPELEVFKADFEKIIAASENLIKKINEIFKLSVNQYNSSVSPNISLENLPVSTIANSSLLPNPEVVENVSNTFQILENNRYRKLKTNEGHILVVDDNRMNRDLISRRLLNQGYQVSCATNGKQGITMLEAEEFDLVLLDIMMPELNGYQVLKYIKADEGLQNIPVIMISALDEIDSVVRCIEMGAEDYLTKPFNPILLKARIGACLEKKRLRDQELVYMETLSRTNEKLTIANDKLLDELSIAKQIQEAMLPKLDSIKDCFNYCRLSASLESARAVGGDFYDFFLLGGGRRLCFLIGDVADKGVPSALLMAKTTTLIRTLVSDSDTPVSLLEKINVELCKDNDRLLFVTLLCGMLDFNTGIVEWASAGHDYPFLINQDHSNIQILPVETGLPLGIEENTTYPLIRSQLETGDTLVLYTDGITEAKNKDDEYFGELRLSHLLGDTSAVSVSELNKAIKDGVSDFVDGYEQSDDITLVCLQYLAVSSRN